MKFKINCHNNKRKNGCIMSNYEIDGNRRIVIFYGVDSVCLVDFIRLQRAIYPTNLIEDIGAEVIERAAAEVRERFPRPVVSIQPALTG